MTDSSRTQHWLPGKISQGLLTQVTHQTPGQVNPTT